MIKRAFDVTATLAGIILLLPLLIVVALLITLDSPGPILFRHRRVGRGFRPFDVYKFRTMSATRTADGAPITFAGDADRRITRIGRMLRRTKLDELPQLVNVLKGEMSLVGPRPEVAEYVELFRKDYEAILEVRPGMTDFASLAYRDEASILEEAGDPVAEYAKRILPDKIRLAREYVQRASFGVDMEVLVRTLLAVLRPSHGTRCVAVTTLLMLSALAVTGQQSGRVRSQRAPATAASRPPADIREYYVSPDGTTDAPGTVDEPIDLATAVSRSSPVGPGDTLWLRGGTYHGPFDSYLTGAAATPIQVRSFPGERVTIDGAAAPSTSTFVVHGSDTWYRDFEVTNTSPDRDRERGIGVDVFAPRVHLVNLVVHDTGNGFGLWSPAIDSELYGNIIYNVGWQEHEQGKGHSIYVQNETGTKRIVDNVLFNGYSFGIHAYTEQGHIDHLLFQGNVSFNHGILTSNRDLKANILVGGWRVAVAPTLVDNFTYVGATDRGRGLELGYWAGCTSASATGNYLAGGIPVRMRRCTELTMTGNTFYGPVDDDTVRDFPDNRYRPTPPDAGTDTFVRPNKHQSGRATIVVFNWQGRASVQVDLGNAGLRAGEPFEVRDVQDYFGVPIVTGAYVPGTLMELPMAHAETTPPVGRPPVEHTTAAFGVFVVQPLAPPASRP